MGPPPAIPQEVQQAWLRQLQRETEVILYAHRLPMRPAALRLQDLQAQWGRYEPTGRCIVLSLRLLQDFDWDVVLEVLKHEMAHQWVHAQAASGAAVRPHGAEFLAACQRLAVASWAVAASGELPTRPGWPAELADPQARALHAKIRKLLALATSSNEHEAALAMQRVREISARHALQRADLACRPAQIHHVFNRQKRRIDRREALIVAILSDHFSVQALYTSQYVAADLQTYKVVEICGSRDQVQFARYVYSFLHQAIDRLVAAHPEKWRQRRCGKASYTAGILDGFADKLRRQTLHPPDAMPEARARALLRLNQQATAAYQSWRHPRVRQRAWGRSSLSAASYAAGQADGQALVLHRPLEAGSRPGGRLLPARQVR